jgi:hypothetical protein
MMRRALVCAALTVCCILVAFAITRCCGDYGYGDEYDFTLSTTTLDFSTADAQRSFAISFNAGVGDRAWHISGTPAWAQLSATSGTDSAVVTVTALRQGLGPGTYQGVLLVSSGDQSETIELYLTVYPPDRPVL